MRYTSQHGLLSKSKYIHKDNLHAYFAYEMIHIILPDITENTRMTLIPIVFIIVTNQIFFAC